MDAWSVLTGIVGVVAAVAIYAMTRDVVRTIIPLLLAVGVVTRRAGAWKRRTGPWPLGE